jgi:glycosyltransferase involved in cell wall biosynthesis
MKTDTALEYAQALVDDLDPGKTVASVAKTGVLEATLTMTDGTTTTASGLFASQLFRRLERRLRHEPQASQACPPTGCHYDPGDTAGDRQAGIAHLSQDRQQPQFCRSHRAALFTSQVMTPQITVLIAAYNRPETLRLAVQSVLAQTYKAAEIIVVDDCSPDHDMRVVLADLPVKVIRHSTNRGLSASRNTGIIEAATEWVAFLDDDDEYLPERLERAADAMRAYQTKGLSLFLCNACVVQPGKPDSDLFLDRNGYNHGWTESDRPLRWVLNNCFFTQSLVARRSVLRATGLFRQTFYEDLDLFVRLCARTPWIIDGKPGFKLIRRPGTAAMSDDLRAKQLERCKALVAIYRNALAVAGTASERDLAQDKLATYLYQLGIATGNRAHFWEAAHTYPKLRSRIKSLLATIAGPWLASRMVRKDGGLVR